MEEEDFDLSEEDFLQAALDIENSNNIIPEQNDSVPLLHNNKSAAAPPPVAREDDHDNAKKNPSRPHSFSVPSFFQSAFDSGDDSSLDLDLSLERSSDAPNSEDIDAVAKTSTVVASFNGLVSPLILPGSEESRVSFDAHNRTVPNFSDRSSKSVLVDRSGSREILTGPTVSRLKGRNWREEPQEPFLRSFNNQSEVPGHHSQALRSCPSEAPRPYPTELLQRSRSDVLKPCFGPETLALYRVPRASASRLDHSLIPAGSKMLNSVVDQTFLLQSNDQKRKRKFPGPAGILPRLKSDSKLEMVSAVKEPMIDNVLHGVDVPSLGNSQSQISSSQETIESHFQSISWKTMRRELGAEADFILSNFNIQSIMKKANEKRLPHGKVPVFCAVIEEIKVHSADAMVTLRDQSGVIYGTMHRELLRDYTEHIQTGTVLVLRQVGVLCPSGRNFYLNITQNNVVRLYDRDETGRPSTVRVRDLTDEDISSLHDETPQSNQNYFDGQLQISGGLRHGDKNLSVPLFSSFRSNSGQDEVGSSSNGFQSPRIENGRPFCVNEPQRFRSFTPRPNFKTPAIETVIQKQNTVPPSAREWVPSCTFQRSIALRTSASVNISSFPPPTSVTYGTLKNNLPLRMPALTRSTLSTLQSSPVVCKENVKNDYKTSNPSTFQFKKISKTTIETGVSPSSEFINKPSDVWNEPEFLEESILSDLTSEFLTDF